VFPHGGNGFFSELSGTDYPDLLHLMVSLQLIVRPVCNAVSRISTEKKMSTVRGLAWTFVAVATLVLLGDATINCLILTTVSSI
jgi:hypothetical protein